MHATHFPRAISCNLHSNSSHPSAPRLGIQAAAACYFPLIVDPSTRFFSILVSENATHFTRPPPTSFFTISFVLVSRPHLGPAAYNSPQRLDRRCLPDKGATWRIRLDAGPNGSATRGRYYGGQRKAQQQSFRRVVEAELDVIHYQHTHRPE
jgi:hypothetical protein